jgi:hypothetical protein
MEFRTQRPACGGTTIRSGSLAAYCVHSPRGAKRLDRPNLRSRAGEITELRAMARNDDHGRKSQEALPDTA